MDTLIDAQDRHIARILHMQAYSKRNLRYGHTLLNRKHRCLKASRQQYERDAAKLGYTESQISASLTDAEEMAILEACDLGLD